MNEGRLGDGVAELLTASADPTAKTYRRWCLFCALLLLSACLAVPCYSASLDHTREFAEIMQPQSGQVEIRGAWDFARRALRTGRGSQLIAGSLTILIALAALACAARRPSRGWVLALTLAGCGALVTSLDAYQIHGPSFLDPLVAKIGSRSPKHLHAEHLAGMLCVVVAAAHAVLRSHRSAPAPRIVGAAAGLTVLVMLTLSGYFRALPVEEVHDAHAAKVFFGRGHVLVDQVFDPATWKEHWAYNLKIIHFLIWGLMGAAQAMPGLRRLGYLHGIRVFGVISLVSIPYLSWHMFVKLEAHLSQAGPLSVMFASDASGDRAWWVARSYGYAYGFLLLMGAGVAALMRGAGAGRTPGTDEVFA